MDEIRPGDFVLVNYSSLRGIEGIVRTVYPGDIRAISVRVPLANIPESVRPAWLEDPQNPGFTPIVLVEGEYEKVHKRGFGA